MCQIVNSDMSDDDGKLGLMEAVSIALGGMIGGGIYAVLGVVAEAAGTLAWLSFLIAGTVAMCAGYSFVRLNRATDSKGGAVTFIEELVGNSDVAGMVGWTLLVGYVGSMALYAFAFGSYFVGIVGVENFAVDGTGIPTRP
ncbi:MAG: amino acid permease, partial [Halobacteria archaeon]|nr:amino acid permease [Halobacteria archaeon]